ncbi:heme-binding protein [Clostridium sp. SHJSY1]|uniref:GlcG/HbpS family heme-binding protein n=1 Tax=Clostridium sp. SHJSY1 TaxID=2942483 RepID=UPI002874B3EE|nr:heme-binding protein [Clostridium sp. SHJSY1]MDS0528234.1 heme-binding protein [Clostridium sp. SHJSY1]
MINENIVNKITETLITSLQSNTLNLKIAKEIITKAEKKAEELKIPVVITIVDEGGNLVAAHRMDDSLLISISASFNKAYTAIALKMPTEQLYDLVLPGKPFYGLESIENGKICVFGGGIPIERNGRFIGAIGVSGGTTEQDILIAKTALL